MRQDHSAKGSGYGIFTRGPPSSTLSILVYNSVCSHTHTRHGLKKLFLTGDCVSDTILSNSDILYVIGHMILDQTIIPISQENQALRG